MADVISVRWLRVRVILQRVLLPLLMLNVVHSHGQQSSATKVWRLGKVEVRGLQQYGLNEVITASGLQVGQQVTQATFKAAAERLVNTGLFESVQYRYQSAGDEIEIIFEVEAATGNIPVVFDNFVWFSDEELVNAVRQEVPSFIGTAPINREVTAAITEALDRLLQERSVPGKVEYVGRRDLEGMTQGLEAHVFKVAKLRIPICTFNFPGATAITEAQLLKESSNLLSSEYSRMSLMELVGAKLIPLYLRRGHLRAKFLNPVAKLEPTLNCKAGVPVVISVEEGLAYFLDRVEWIGNEAVSTKDLEKLLGMKSGKLADGTKVEARLFAIRQAYRRKGYKQANVSAEPQFDDATRRVTSRITISEGMKSR